MNYIGLMGGLWKGFHFPLVLQQAAASINCTEATQSARESFHASASDQQQQRNQRRSNGKHRTDGDAVLGEEVDKLLHSQKTKLFSSDLCPHPLEGLTPMEFERSVSSTETSIVQTLQS